MTRYAKLYTIRYTDWKPLVEKIEQHKDYSLKNLIAIYDLSKNHPGNQYYAILSLHEDIDKIVEDYGAKESPSNDYLRITLHDENEIPVYGEKSRIVYLDKTLIQPA
jgi:hypothetical protein